MEPTIISNDPKNPNTGTIFLRDVTVLDCGIFDPCQGVMGQSWIVDLELSGELDADGLVFDFSTLKKLVRSELKSTLDHALIIPIESHRVEFSDQGDGETWTLTSQKDRNSKPLTWVYECPKGAAYPIRSLHLDKEVITTEFSKVLRKRLPETVGAFKIRLREEKVDPTEAVFQYTHGISNHEGLCQRLFHGHRSCLEVYLNDERRPDLEHEVVWNTFGKSVHIASTDQLISEGLEPESRFTSSSPIQVGYSTEMGQYKATLPGNKVFVVEGTTSIETITASIAKVVRRKVGPTKDVVKVVCYEGIEKGAIALA